MGSHDGGIPVVSQRWDGHTSATQVFPKRAEAWLRAVPDTPSPRSLVAAAKRAGEDPATPLATLGLIPRIPATRPWVSPVMGPALQGETWPSVRAHTRDQPLAWGHDGMAPRGLGVSSQAALARAEAPLQKATQREAAAITTHLLPLQAPRVGTPAAAQEARGAWAQRWT